ncbi:TIGR04282 family arsenosugar biosynthesis glycosyltransferase [Rhodobacteraceae bacterium M382]|nr:TIGR04282 family arsenosugar biosynthesis glycosyltransferase [Rhodobacteraceae bacterium M382]
MKRTLVIMVKVPRPGRVKTRLGRDIGMDAAAWWFRHQSARLIRRLRDPRWQIVLAVAPDVAGMASKVWPADLHRIPQGNGDLGDRMGRILRSMPAGPVCIIGADIPGITRTHVARAFAALGDHDAVFGPAFDGGYWLVGAKRVAALPSGMFRNVRWSTPHALADTIATLPGRRIAQVDQLRDVDTVLDLQPAPLP